MRSGSRRLVVVAALVLAGCAARAPRPAPTTTAAAPLDAAAARAVVERRASESRTLTAMFSIEMRRADGGSETSRGAVAVVRPDRLRLQIFSLGVVTAYDFTVAGERYHLRRPLEGVDVVGRFDDAASPSATDLGRDLRPLFLLPAATAAERVEDRADRLRVTVEERAGRRLVDVRKADGRIVAERLLDGGEPRVEIEYGDYRPVDGADLPFAIRVRYPRKGVEVTIAVRSYTRNAPVDPKLFEF